MVENKPGYLRLVSSPMELSIITGKCGYLSLTLFANITPSISGISISVINSLKLVSAFNTAKASRADKQVTGSSFQCFNWLLNMVRLVLLSSAINTRIPLNAPISQSNDVLTGLRLGWVLIENVNTEPSPGLLLAEIRPPIKLT